MRKRRPGSRVCHAFVISANVVGRYELTKLMGQQWEGNSLSGLLLARRIVEFRSLSIASILTGALLSCRGTIARGGSLDFFSLIGRTADAGSSTVVHGVMVGNETHGQYLSECQVMAEGTFIHLPGTFCTLKISSVLPKVDDQLLSN
jgi:hypothetical protein